MFIMVILNRKSDWLAPPFVVSVSRAVEAEDLSAHSCYTVNCLSQKPVAGLP